MPRPCTFEAPLAEMLEDSRAVREIFRDRRALLGWPSKVTQGLPSLECLGFNSQIMVVFAECFTKNCKTVKSPPVAWVRREVSGRCLKTHICKHVCMHVYNFSSCIYTYKYIYVHGRSASVRLKVKKFCNLMSIEQTALHLHLDVWGMKKLFSNGLRRWGVSIGSRKASPEVSQKVLHAC